MVIIPLLQRHIFFEINMKYDSCFIFAGGETQSSGEPNTGFNDTTGENREGDEME